MNANLIAQKAMTTPAQSKVSLIEQELAKCPQIGLPLVHRFTPGLYIREIFMPRGTLVISKIHKTEHPFVCLKGHCAVWTEEKGVVQVRAGDVGITKPGTRRILYMHESTVWVTFHPTTKTDLKEIENDVIFDPKKHAVADVDQELVRKLIESC